MEEVKEWVVRYKQPVILVGVAGMLTAPFLWPFYLAIVFESVSLIFPVVIIGAVIRRIRKEKQNDQKRDEKFPDATDAEIYDGWKAQDGSVPEKTETRKADPVQKSAKEIGKEGVRRTKKESQKMSDASCLALMWYQLDGRERILRLKKKAEQAGQWSFSVSPEGICSVREGDRFRRIGALRSYPCREFKILAKELQKDHIRTAQKGRYLWLSWGREALG